MRLIDLATESCPDEIINLASGIGYTIRDYATMICEEVGYDASQIEYDTTQYVGVEQKVLSTAKLRRIADFGFTDIRAGLAEVVADYSGGCFLRCRHHEGGSSMNSSLERCLRALFWARQDIKRLRRAPR